MFRLKTKTNKHKLRFLEIARSIFLICHPPLFHNSDLAVAFFFLLRSRVVSWVSGLRRSCCAQIQRGNLRAALIRCEVPPRSVFEYHVRLQEGPRKGRCGPLACCLLGPAARPRPPGLGSVAQPSSFPLRY